MVPTSEQDYNGCEDEPKASESAPIHVFAHNAFVCISMRWDFKMSQLRRRFCQQNQTLEILNLKHIFFIKKRKKGKRDFLHLP